MNEYEVYQDILRRLQEEPATCSGCYKHHEPTMCPHAAVTIDCDNCGYALEDWEYDFSSVYCTICIGLLGVSL